MGGVSGNAKLKRPDEPNTGFGYFRKDPITELENARAGYVKNTGRTDLKDVRESGAFKKMSKDQQQIYLKRNKLAKKPKDKSTLETKTLLGG
tara:strand:- start:240 stop:515 length:276 start_codon:yes stop_codon:yes gene_type:complete